MVASAPFAALLPDLLAPLGHITTRRMFGKTGVCCDGLMLGMVTEDTLYLRVDDGNREALREAAGTPPLSYRKGGRSIGLAFWQIPERLLDDPDELLGWARAGLDAARRVAARRTRAARIRSAASGV